MLQKDSIVLILFVTGVIEVVTVIFRFGFHLTAVSRTQGRKKLTGGYRMHHGYIGLVLMLLGFVVSWQHLSFLILGAGLFLSDILRHFVVLRLLTGKHEFSFRYPC